VEDPRLADWLQKAAILSHFSQCPDDPEEREFLLAMAEIRAEEAEN
jgi:hypothetical protein